ncbi:MAG: DUF4358 domain-containing protein [Clostridiales bacterium]|nr:DUF4358 domain-containing protein [Clostridiales bacterium]
MKKLISVILAGTMLVSMAACSADKPSGGSDATTTTTEATTAATEESKDTEATEETKASEVTPEAIEKAIADALGDGYLATEAVNDDNMLSSALRYLETDQLVSYVAKIAKVTAVDQDQIVIAECKDGYADEAVNLLNESFSQTIGYIRQYPYGVAKVEGARLFKSGNIVIFVIAGAKAADGASAEDEATLAASEYQKVDDAVKNVLGNLPDNLAVVKEPDNGGGGGGLIGG